MNKKSSWSWRVVAGIGLLSVAVLGTGLGMAIFGAHGESAASQPLTQPQTTKPKAPQATQTMPNSLNLVALGDSLTAGVGDASGKGYIGDLRDMLVKSGKVVTVQNMAVSGLQSPELVHTIQSPSVQSMLKTANMVYISIGANDLTHSVGDPMQIISTDQIDEKKIIATEETYTQNMKTILQTVRANNADAPVFVIGLYNPFEGMIDDKNGVLDRNLNTWNTNVMKITQQFKNVKLVPMFDIFQWNTNHLLAGDHFHPNQEGYNRMATRLLQALPPDAQTKQ
ncbi:MAG: GDSL-type esterase/lipase family protein [Tumebacillaceae bacterium]